jgi:hypothetical protein
MAFNKVALLIVALVSCPSIPSLAQGGGGAGGARGAAGSSAGGSAQGGNNGTGSAQSATKDSNSSTQPKPFIFLANETCYIFRDAWAGNHHYCIRGALGDGARAYSLRASTYRSIAGGERTLTV